jgi:membrane protein YdbS with pleckstrin-like domain
MSGPAPQPADPAASARQVVFPSVERGLHPAVQIGWILRGAVNSLLLGVGLLLLESRLARGDMWLPLRPPLSGLLLAGVVLMLSLWHARRLYTGWTWALRSDDVVASFGVLWRVSRSIPRVRVQHVDVSSGPIDRALGLVHVSLHVAGAMGPVLTIPGLAPAEAEGLQQALLDSARSS